MDIPVANSIKELVDNLPKGKKIAYSFHEDEDAAKKFAQGLIEQEAEGVHIGIKTSAGYPVYSMVDAEIADVASLHSEEKRDKKVEDAYKRYKEQSGEEYKELGSVNPASWHLAAYEMADTVPTLTRREALSIAEDMLRKHGLHNVKVSISKHQGNTPFSPYADATTSTRANPKTSRFEAKISLYPTVLYADVDYIREVMEHEIGHILDRQSEAKTKKDI